MKNKKEILSTGNISTKRKVIDILEYAISQSIPSKKLKENIAVSNKKLKIFGINLNRKDFEDIVVVGAGKASYEMAKEVESILLDEIREGLVITKYGYKEWDLKKIDILEAGHPVPDKNSEKGARKILNLISEAKENDLIINLISGGGSSLLCAPSGDITLENMKKTTELLVSSNATIDEINSVRKNISEIKGGKLAIRSYPRTCISLIVSDVVGDNLETISSGPTVYDSSKPSDAVNVLKDHYLLEKIPKTVRNYLSKKAGSDQRELKKYFDNGKIHNIIVVSNDVATEAAKERGEELGLNSLILSRMIEGESKEAGIFTGGILRDILRTETPIEKPCLLISGGETTVTLSGKKGEGGPNQEFALGSASKIDGIKGVAVAAVDTDGTDGPTDIAGGIVDGNTYNQIKKLGLNFKKELENHNSKKLLKKANGTIILGPTGTNVNDLRLAIVDDTKR